MFTGLIEAVGEILAIRSEGGGARLDLRTPKEFAPLAMGESIAVNGVCVTAESLSETGFAADLSDETLQRTTFRDLRSGAAVNLERALRLGDRLGGHMVSGHVDGVGAVRRIASAGGGWTLEVEAPPAVLSLCIEKGSIAVDGTSLTIAELMKDAVTCVIIPTTWRETNLSTLSEGDRVNLESDLIGKYVQRLLAPQSQFSRGVTWDTLKDAGFV